MSKSLPKPCLARMNIKIRLKVLALECLKIFLSILLEKEEELKVPFYESPVISLNLLVSSEKTPCAWCRLGFGLAGRGRLCAQLLDLVDGQVEVDHPAGRLAAAVLLLPLSAGVRLKDNRILSKQSINQSLCLNSNHLYLALSPSPIPNFPFFASSPFFLPFAFFFFFFFFLLFFLLLSQLKQLNSSQMLWIHLPHPRIKTMTRAHMASVC